MRAYSFALSESYVFLRTKWTRSGTSLNKVWYPEIIRGGLWRSSQVFISMECADFLGFASQPFFHSILTLSPKGWTKYDLRRFLRRSLEICLGVHLDGMRWLSWVWLAAFFHSLLTLSPNCLFSDFSPEVCDFIMADTVPSLSTPYPCTLHPPSFLKGVWTVWVKCVSEGGSNVRYQ